MKTHLTKPFWLLAVLVVFPFTLYAQSNSKLHLTDSRALKNYSTEEINSMPEYKIYQVNYLYADSWKIPGELKNEIDAKEIIITDYSAFRHDSKEQKVFLQPEKMSGPYIILKSKAEVRKHLSLIEEQYN
ncbi:MAG: hypothetical protein ACQES0_10455 [Bacteroidota bacterium]